MASASKTPNLNLPQWVGTEKPERTDFNAAFDAIDTTVASHMADYATEIGDVETLTTTSKVVVGAVNELNTNKANKVQEGWITPTLLNGWVEASPGDTPRYMKDEMGFVHVVGAVTGGTEGSPIFYLPIGYRPIDTSPVFLQYALGGLTTATGYVSRVSGAITLETIGNNKNALFINFAAF